MICPTCEEEPCRSIEKKIAIYVIEHIYTDWAESDRKYSETFQLMTYAISNKIFSSAKAQNTDPMIALGIAMQIGFEIGLRGRELSGAIAGVQLPAYDLPDLEAVEQWYQTHYGSDDPGKRVMEVLHELFGSNVTFLKIPIPPEPAEPVAEDEIFVLPENSRPWQVPEFMTHPHIHTPSGSCVKNRFGRRCAPKKPEGD